MIYTPAKTHQQGVTLIEIVFALVLIALGASAISALLVGGLNIDQTNKQSFKDVRDATSCYETILAIHETVGWDQTTKPRDSCSEEKTNIDSQALEMWVSEDVEDELTEFCEVEDRRAGKIECENIPIDSESDETANATHFNIAINEGRSIDLVLPWSDDQNIENEEDDKDDENEDEDEDEDEDNEDD